MTWFRDLVGFDETTGDEVRARLRLDGDRLHSTVNGRTMRCGTLEVASLAELRARAVPGGAGTTTVRELVGDAAALHRDPANAGATFQVASQFNLLEMVSPHVSPEAGVAGYENDPTQGPACAVACGAATIYRNYFVEVDGERGQTAERQVDGLADVAGLLFPEQMPPWTMRNGYAMFDHGALDAVEERLDELDGDGLDRVRAALRVGLHRDAEVTKAPAGHDVTQVFCSALPVAYNTEPAARFEAPARLVLDATYEATLLAAVENAHRTGNRTVFLTLVGGGVFGNAESWIVDAIDRAVGAVADAGLDVVVVSFRATNPALGPLLSGRADRTG